MIERKFGLIIRELRLEKGVSQEKLALETDIDRSYISDIEKGNRKVSIVIIEKLAKYFDISISKLFAQMEEKFKNIRGKTAQYDVPKELWQKRTSVSNRVLLRWKLIKQNKITLNQLKTFYGGLCVDFVNDDFINPQNQKNKLFQYLKSQLGGNDMISSMISIRNEDGSSSSQFLRDTYRKIVNIVGKDNLKPIERNAVIPYSGFGRNDVWKGNFYYSIRGGQQNSIESHKNISPQLFNPAISYANELVANDLYIVLSYFALFAEGMPQKNFRNIKVLKEKCENYLQNRNYDSGNLLDYCTEHPSLSYNKRILMDPIQIKPIRIEYFGNCKTSDRCVICHNQAATKNIITYDKSNGFLLSSSNPMNMFWSTHLSNMLQQDYTLTEYYVEEDKRVKKRKKILKGK